MMEGSELGALPAASSLQAGRIESRSWASRGASHPFTAAFAHGHLRQSVRLGGFPLSRDKLQVQARGTVQFVTAARLPRGIIKYRTGPRASVAWR